MKIYMKITNSSVKNEINFQLINIIKFFINKHMLTIPQLTTSNFWKDFLFLYKRNFTLQLNELRDSYKNSYDVDVQVNELNKFLFETNKIPQILIHRKIYNFSHNYTFVYEIQNNINTNVYIELVFD